MIRQSALSLALLAALAACRTDEPRMSPRTMSTADDFTTEFPEARGSQGTMVSADLPRGPFDDATILGLVACVSEHEIEMAELAKRKDVPSAVDGFAEMMIEDHGRNLEKTRKVAGHEDLALIDNETIATEKRLAAQEMARLEALRGDTFEREYVAAMVRGHERVLKMIDERLLPAAKDGDVREHLRETRASVARHLDSALRIQRGEDAKG